MTHNVRYQGWRSVESSCNPPMWPQSCTQSLLAFWSVGVAPLTKQPEDSVYEIDAAWVQVRNRRRVGFSAGAPHFPFLQKPTFRYSSLFVHYNSQTVSPHSVHKKTGLHYHRDEIHQLQRSWRKSNSSWNIRKLLSEFLNRQIIKQVKPASHTPPMHLRHARLYCLGWEQKWPAELVIPVFTVGMPVKLTQVQLRSHAGGKALRLFYLPVAHVLIRPRSSPGGTSGYFEDTSAAYEN